MPGAADGRLTAVKDHDSCVRGFAELTLMAEDREALASFYEAVFVMRRLIEDDDRIWLAVGDGARLGIWSPGAKEHNDRGGRHVHFAFSVTPGTQVACAGPISWW